jgi:hypothetical protein
MTETTFVQHWAREGFSYWEAGSGETVVAIVGDSGPPTRAHALLAERRRVMVFAMAAEAGTPQEAARRIGAMAMALDIERFDVMGEGAGAATAMWLALAPEVDIGSVVLAAPASILGACSMRPSARCSGRCSCSPGHEGPVRCRRPLAHLAARLPLHVRL